MSNTTTSRIGRRTFAECDEIANHRHYDGGIAAAPDFDRHGEWLMVETGFASACIVVDSSDDYADVVDMIEEALENSGGMRKVGISHNPAVRRPWIVDEDGAEWDGF